MKKLLFQEEELQRLRSYEKNLSAKNDPDEKSKLNCELFVRKFHIFYDESIPNDLNDDKIFSQLRVNSSAKFKLSHM